MALPPPDRRLRRTVIIRGEEFENISILVAIGVSSDGYREIIGAAEGLKEDLESWKNFFVWLKQRGLKDPRLIIGDKALGMVEATARYFHEQSTSDVSSTSIGMYLRSHRIKKGKKLPRCSKPSMHRRIKKLPGKKQKL